MSRRRLALILAGAALALPAVALADPPSPACTGRLDRRRRRRPFPRACRACRSARPCPPPRTPSSGTTTSVGGDQASHPHFWDLPGRIKQSINDWFQGLVLDALTPMLDLVGKTVLATPQLAANAQVGQLWKLSLLSADALLVLFVLVAAGLAMSHDTMQTRYALKDLIGRLAFAGIAINASLALCGQMITLANALAAGFLGDGASAAGGASSLQTFIVGALGRRRHLHHPARPCLRRRRRSGCSCSTCCGRRSWSCSICAAPLMLLCHLFPQTEGLAQLWWRAMAACFAIQIAQALVLAAAVRVFFTGAGGSGLGLSVTGAVINMLICLCLLVVLVKIPFWAKQLAFGRSGSSTTVRLAKLYVARQTGIPRAVL